MAAEDHGWISHDDGHRTLAYPDLGATVVLGQLPEAAAEELPGLYESAFSVAEYFPIFRRFDRLNACLLDGPRHVLAFIVGRDGVEVLNRVFAIEPESMDRMASAVFRALPDARRMTVQVPFEAAALRAPALTLQRTADIVVAFPLAASDAMGLLSSSARKHTRNYRNRLRRDHPDHEFVVYQDHAIDEELVRAVVDLTRTSLTARGVQPHIPDDYAARLVPFVRRWGFVPAVTVGGRVAAADLCSQVGDQAFDHLGSFDPAFAYHELGWLCALHVVETAIERGCNALHLLWGEQDYKYRLGGLPHPLATVAVYRDAASRLAAIGDWGGLAAGRAQGLATRAASAARHGGRLILRRRTSDRHG